MTDELCDIHVKGGVLVNSHEMKPGDVFIKDGIVDSIERPNSAKTAKKTIDASGKLRSVYRLGQITQTCAQLGLAPARR